MVSLVFFRRAQKEIDIDCDIREITPSDYTIFLVDLPKDISAKYIGLKETDIPDYKEELKNFFETELVTDQSLKITDINLIYDLKELK